MELIYPAYFSPLGGEDGYCVAFPDLPGCVTQGDNLSDSIKMAEDAACGWILDEIEDGKQLPKPSRLQDIKLESEHDFVNFILLDIDSYAEKFGEKAVRKNCTIPAWLNTVSERAGVNFSAVLQNALIEQLKLS